MYKFAFNNLWLKKSRSGLALTGLAIAIIGIIGLTSISAGIRANITDAISKMEGVNVLQDGALDDAFSSVSTDLINDIESLPEAKVVAPIISGMAREVDGKPIEIQFSAMGGMVMYMGVDPSKNVQLKYGSMYNPRISKGRTLNYNDKFGVVLGSKVAEDYKKSVGSNMEVNGIKFKVVGVYESGSMLIDGTMGVHIDTAREMSNKPNGFVSMLYVEPRNAKDAEKLATKINFRFDKEVDAKTGSGFSQEIGGIISNLDTFFLAISSIALFVGAVGILNTMLMSVLERTKEFGILKAIGWTPDDIIKLVVFESIYLGIIGGVIGIILAYLGLLAMDPFLPFKFLVTPEMVVTSFMLAVVLGLFGGLYPAWKASRLDPVQTIRFG